MSTAFFEFEWVNHSKVVLYQSKVLAYKIKQEKIEKLDKDDAPVLGYEVYVARDKLLKDWKPLRFFPNTHINNIRKWVEQIAERTVHQIIEEHDENL